MTKQDTLNINGIGYRIRELRKKKGLTQKELGQLLNCAQNTIAEWEKREGRGPSKIYLSKVAQALGVSIDYLLGLERHEKFEIPCYGEISTDVFDWPKSSKTIHYVEVPQSEYAPGRYSLKLLDNFLEPIATKGDYCIFERVPPEDGNIVIARSSENYNQAMVRIWKQQENAVILSGVNIYESNFPYLLEFIQRRDSNFTYPIKGKTQERVVVEGRLVIVKRIIKQIRSYPGIRYIFSTI